MAGTGNATMNGTLIDILSEGQNLISNSITFNVTTLGYTTPIIPNYFYTISSPAIEINL